MNTKDFRWAAGLLLLCAVLLGLCGGMVRLIDPFFHYRAPDPEREVWFDQRAQGAGLLRTQEYETLLLGTSMTANYHPVWFDVYYETSTVKVTFPDGGFGEFTTALDYANTRQEVKRVIFGLDPNLMARAPERQTDELPHHLYDDDPWNDVHYLLNKDSLMRSVYALLNRDRAIALQDAFMWDGVESFSRADALAGYKRPETVTPMLEADALLENARGNLQEITGWLERYPDTEFIFLFPPYSILSWDKEIRNGRMEAMFALLDEVTATLLTYDNAQLQFFMADTDTITNLDRYADHIHVAGAVTFGVAGEMRTGSHVLTEENRREVLDGLYEFVVHYDYESIWAQ